MDIVWEKKKYFKDTLKDCENGAVVLLEKYPNYGPFLVVGRENDAAKEILLFDFGSDLSALYNVDEHVEIMNAELRIS